MSFHKRLSELEASARRQLGDTGTRQNWIELRNLFAADSDDGPWFEAMALEAGTRNLRQLLTHPGVGSRLGQFCRRHRLKCPEAHVVRMRRIIGHDRGDRIVRFDDDSETKFLQILMC